MRTSPRRLAAAAVVLAALAVAVFALLRWPPPWNVLLVTFDTTRADHVGCYGNPHARTPTLDRLAAEGIRYAACFAPVPLTLPSHSTLMTGLYPFSHGVHENGQILADSAVTLAELLARRGYRTGAAVGAFVLDRRFGLDQGFERYDDDLSAGVQHGRFTFPERDAEQVTDAALGFLAEAGRGPYFLWVHYFDPHAPYGAPGQERELTGASPYDAEITRTDAQLGRLLEAIDADPRHPTLVIVTADHGEGLWEHGEPTHGAFLYQSTMHVPLIVRFPDSRGAGAVIDEPVGLADVLPSVLAWLGIEERPRVHGRVLPTAADANPREPRPLYLENWNPASRFGWSPLAAVVHDGWKLVEAPRPELYRLAEDRHEAHDLHASEPAVAERLHATLRDLRQDPEGPPRLEPGERVLDDETVTKLLSLGYLGTHAPRDAEVGGADPKDRIDVLHRIFEAHALIDDERPAEAAERLIAILREDDPQNPWVLSLLATLAPHEEVRESAVPVLAQRDPQRLPPPLDFLVPAKLGLALAGLGRYAEAAEAFRSALAAQEDSASVRVNLAAALELQGRPFEEWLPELERAVDLEPENADYARRLAQAYERTGHEAKASDGEMRRAEEAR